MRQNAQLAERPLAQGGGDERNRVTIGFDKPGLLQQLFGEYDANLITIEKRLGVYISARGERVTIEGASDAVEHATETLRSLYRLVETGERIDEGVIQAHIGFTSKAGASGADATVVPIDRRGGGLPAVSIRTRKTTLYPRNDAQAVYMQRLATDEAIFAVGPAGTGKTYLAVAQAVADLIAGKVERLIFSRPAVEAGERLGFLPGDMKEKVDPYLRPIYDALNDCLPPEQVERRIASGEIEIAPIAFMRGRTLANAFILLDEAQNTTPAQMKMFLTRFGQNSRMVICGDARQTDLPLGPGAKSGLVDALDRLDGVQGISICKFEAKDVVRHELVGRIVTAYEG